MFNITQKFKYDMPTGCVIIISREKINFKILYCNRPKRFNFHRIVVLFVSSVTMLKQMFRFKRKNDIKVG